VWGQVGRSGDVLFPLRRRIAGHIRLLGILWLAVSAFRLIPGLIIGGFSFTGMFPPEMPPFVRGIIPMMGLMFLVSAAIGVAVGCGLLMRQPWARMLAIIFGGIGLVDIPFGTALGIYTLWVLLPAQSEQEYRSMARVA
jgi:hypothetical protein